MSVDYNCTEPEKKIMTQEQTYSLTPFTKLPLRILSSKETKDSGLGDVFDHFSRRDVCVQHCNATWGDFINSLQHTAACSPGDTSFYVLCVYSP